MKRAKTLILFSIFITFNLAFIKPNYIEWSSSKKLDFSDFKAKPPAGKTSKVVELKTIISYEIQQEKGKVPKVKVLNFVDRNASWIKLRKQSILDIQQIRFDYSELYVRKARKEIESMTKKGIKSKEAYINTITKYANQFEKNQRKRNIALDDQPHLIKLSQQSIKDSLEIFKNYAK